VDEVAARSVRTESGRVERPTQIRFVLRMTHDGAKFRLAVRELALAAVATRPVLLVRTTEFRLVTCWRRRRCLLRCRLDIAWADSLVQRIRLPDALGPPLSQLGRRKPQRRESRVTGPDACKFGMVVSV